MSSSNYVHLDVEEIIWETDEAFLCKVDDEDHWIPKSQIADSNDYKAGMVNCTISITQWMANKLDFEEEDE